MQDKTARLNEDFKSIIRRNGFWFPKTYSFAACQRSLDISFFYIKGARLYFFLTTTFASGVRQVFSGFREKREHKNLAEILKKGLAIYPMGVYTDDSSQKERDHGRG